MPKSFVYILASKKNGTLYIGVTKDLQRRMFEHKNNMVEGFTEKYAVHHLVYYELYDELLLAIQPEKQMKEWKRQWKINLIEKENPQWRDLYNELNH